MRLHMIRRLKAMDEVPEIRKLARNILAEYDDLNIVLLLYYDIEELRRTTNRHNIKKQPYHIMHKLEEAIKALEKMREYRYLLVNAIEAHISVGEKMSDELKNEHLPQFVEFLDDTLLNDNFQKTFFELKEQLFGLIEIRDWETLKEMTESLKKHEVKIKHEIYGIHVCKECGYCPCLDECYSTGEFDANANDDEETVEDVDDWYQRSINEN